jgi:hypothetical protein
LLFMRVKKNQNLTSRATAAHVIVVVLTNYVINLTIAPKMDLMLP